MRKLVLGSIVMLVAAVTGTAAGASALHAAGCATRIETIKGQQVSVNCGPATAQLRYKGGAYSFKDGTCFRAVGPSIKLYLGKQLFASSKGGNTGFSELDLTMLTGGAMNVEISVGKLDVGEAATYSGSVRGTFKGIDSPLSGSWNCGGPIQSS